MKPANAPAESIEELKRRLPRVMHLETAIGDRDHGQVYYLWAVRRPGRRGEWVGYRGPAKRGRNC